MNGFRSSFKSSVRMSDGTFCMVQSLTLMIGLSRFCIAKDTIFDVNLKQTFFTAGKDECRAWTFKKGMKAPECAGIIHTDFEKGFIRAEVISYEDYIEYGSEVKVREAGKMRVEGKEYVVLLPTEKDADAVLVLEIVNADTDDEMYVSVEEEAIEEAVFALFEERYAAEEEI